MAESRTEKDIDADVEEAMKRYYMKKIKEKLKTEDRLSTLRVVYYVLKRE
jgi:phosphomannomutase|nr:MAG TPA: hypothetical protein [Bacteriophage sp.]